MRTRRPSRFAECSRSGVDQRPEKAVIPAQAGIQQA